MIKINSSVLSGINMLILEDKTKQLRLNQVFNVFCFMSLLLSTLINIFRVADSHSYRTRGSLYNL